MREIKFRAWNTKKSEMINGDDDLDYGGNGPSGETEWCSMTSLALMYQRCNWILMQCTGLRDRNGTEIYEGDIMAFKKDYPCYVVQYKATKFDFFNNEGHYGESFSGFYDEYEVIGNIYENPELLANKSIEI